LSKIVVEWRLLKRALHSAANFNIGVLAFPVAHGKVFSFPADITRARGHCGHSRGTAGQDRGQLRKRGVNSGSKTGCSWYQRAGGWGPFFPQAPRAIDPPAAVSKTTGPSDLLTQKIRPRPQGKRPRGVRKERKEISCWRGRGREARFSFSCTFCGDRKTGALPPGGKTTAGDRPGSGFLGAWVFTGSPCIDVPRSLAPGLETCR